MLKWEYNDLNANSIGQIFLQCGLPDDNDIFKWRFTLAGPLDTSYAGGLFFLKILFPEDYPYKGRKIIFIAPIYHLNVNNIKRLGTLGHVSVSFLNLWEGTDIREISAKLYTIFYMPNPESPYDFDRAKEFKENRDLYELKVKYFTEKYASINLDQKEYDKSWDFTIDEKDPKFLKLKEKSNEKKIETYNTSNDNN